VDGREPVVAGAVAAGRCGDVVLDADGVAVWAGMPGGVVVQQPAGRRNPAFAALADERAVDVPRATGDRPSYTEAMPLVFAGACSHAPGIVGRAEQADPDVRHKVYSAYGEMAEALAAARPDALMVVAAEHFGNFFMDNMPSFAIGMADRYEGPVEDPEWLGIERFTVPGDRDLSHRLIAEIMQTSDVSYAEEWKLDHGIAVPLHFLTPRHDLRLVPVNINCQGPPLTPYERVWAFGEAIRRAADLVPERVAVVGTGGISHWPATPDSGKINEAWDRDFLDRWCCNDRDALLDYDDLSVYAEAGQGAFEIRTFIAVSAAAAGAAGTVHCYQPVPIFAVGCTVATYDLATAAPCAGSSPAPR